MIMVFFFLGQGDDWVITEDCSHGLQRLQKTRGWGCRGESESRSVSFEDIVWGFLDQLTWPCLTLGPVTDPVLSASESAHFWWMKRGSFRGEGGSENLVGVRA